MFVFVSAQHQQRNPVGKSPHFLETLLHPREHKCEHSGLFDYLETLIIDRSSDTSGLVMPAQDIKMEQVNVKCWSGASNAYIECIYKVSAFTNGSSPFSVGAIYINLTAAMLVYFSVNIERKILQQSSIVFYKY